MTQPGDGSLTTMTWEGWVKPETKDGVIMCKYDTQGPDDNSYIISFRDNGFFKSTAIEYFGGGHSSAITDDSYSEPGEWVYLTSTFDLGGDNFIDQYVDGDDVPSTIMSNSGDFMRDISISDDLGRYRPEAGTKYTDSVIDEVRWSKIVRNDAWIKTSFNTMDDPSGFMDFGSEETGP